jgi:hypothetical protein
MGHDLPYLGNDPPVYETALRDLFQKNPSRIRFSITIHEAGKLVGQFISIHEWSGAKSIPERATLMAETIVADCKLLEGRIVKRLTLNF